MGVVSVGWVVEVDEARLGELEDFDEICDDVLVAGVFDFFAGVAELDHDAVFADEGCFTLFLFADFLHFFVGVGVVGPFARAAGAVGDDDAAEPLVAATEAFGDAVVGCDFEVVLVADDAEVGDACEGLSWVALVRDEEVGVRVVEEHGWCCDCRGECVKGKG